MLVHAEHDDRDGSAAQHCQSNVSRELKRAATVRRVVYGGGSRTKSVCLSLGLSSVCNNYAVKRKVQQKALAPHSGAMD